MVFMLMTSHFLFFLTIVNRGLCFELGVGGGFLYHPKWCARVSPAYQIKLPANSEHPARFLYILLYLSVAAAIEHRSLLVEEEKGEMGTE